MSQIKAPSLLLLQLLLPIGFAHAQPPVDAGALQQQIEKERSNSLPKESLPQIDRTPQPMKAIEGASVIVNQFNFVGNTLLSSVALDDVVASYLSRELTFNELQKAATEVAEAYRQAGWIVRAYLPKQEIVDGVVTIQVVEASFGGVKLEGDSPTRFNAEHARNMVESAQALGTALNADRLDRALLLLNDLPGIAASGTLAQGAGQGETDLMLKLANEPLFSGEIGADNTGVYSTGSNRMTANLYLNSPLKVGDQVTANVIHSSGNDYLRLAYSLPVGHDGWRLGASGSWLSYDIVEGDFKNADLEGSSSTLGINASYPLIRSRLKNLYVGFSADNKDFDNEAANSTTTKYEINSLSMSFFGNLFDKLGGGGANSAEIRYTNGDVDLSSRDNRKALSPNVDGNFNKLNYSLSRQQFLTNQMSLYAAISGQEASNNLDSAEKFYLGGAYGVRAYPVNEGSGSDGQLLNLELRMRLQKGVVMTAFYDLGHVNNTDTVPNSITLKGAGLSGSWTADFGLNLKATWAHRIGSNPNPANNGDDQDGTLRKNRFWLQATMPF
jgi:hemolysin activation/secretion protein